MSDINVYLSRQRGEGSLIKRTSLRSSLFCSINPSAGVTNVHGVKKLPVIVQNEERIIYVKVDLMTVFIFPATGEEAKDHS